MIAIIDYGAGNIYSVLNRLKTMRVNAKLTSDKSEIENSDGLILPGVGAFGYAAQALQGLGLYGIIKDFVKIKPILGICLGMQLLFDSSEESVGAQGLGLIKGNVTRIKAQKKIPHIGWTSLNNIRGNLLETTKENEYFYFVHSFGAHAVDRSFVAATAEYGEEFDSVVEKGNIFGTQFHPEKSGNAGLKIFEKFVRLCKK